MYVYCLRLTKLFLINKVLVNPSLLLFLDEEKSQYLLQYGDKFSWHDGLSPAYSPRLF